MDGNDSGARVVVSTWLERGYPWDTSLHAREAAVASVYAGDNAGSLSRARFLAELDADLHAPGILSLRRSYMLHVALPSGNWGGQCLARWGNDRTTVFLSRLGARPGGWVKASVSGRIHEILLDDMHDRIGDLASSVAQDDRDSVVANALGLVGASTRCLSEGAVAPDCHEKVSSLARRIGDAAWDGAALGELVQELSLLQEGSVGVTPAELMPASEASR